MAIFSRLEHPCENLIPINCVLRTPMLAYVNYTVEDDSLSDKGTSALVFTPRDALAQPLIRIVKGSRKYYYRRSKIIKTWVNVWEISCIAHVRESRYEIAKFPNDHGLTTDKSSRIICNVIKYKVHKKFDKRTNNILKVNCINYKLFSVRTVKL